MFPERLTKGYRAFIEGRFAVERGRYQHLAKDGWGTVQDAQQYTSQFAQQQAAVQTAQTNLKLAQRQIEALKELAQLESTHGPENDFVSRVGEFYLSRSEKAGYSGAAMYDPLAVGTAIDPTLVTLKEMHADVETKGEFTRGETVANRMGENERNVLHGDHYEIEGYDKLPVNARVCVASDSGRFMQLFISRMRGK